MGSAMGAIPKVDFPPAKIIEDSDMRNMDHPNAHSIESVVAALTTSTRENGSKIGGMSGIIRSILCP